MPLNCPQRGENLRLQAPEHSPQRRSRDRHQRPMGVGTAMIVAAIGLAACFALLTGCAAAQPGSSGAEYCNRDFSDTSARRDDVAELQAAGGLNYIFSQGHVTPPFECATQYLALGLDVNATSPSTDLTPLHYAISANTAQLVTFLIDHGADLHKKAGEKNLEPMGYAYYLAVNNRAIDRNQVIAIINQALNQADSQP